MDELVWKTWIPITVEIGPPYCPEPVIFLLKAWRNSYIGQFFPILMSFFKPMMLESTESQEWWLNTEDNQPVPWHWPSGLAYDHLCPRKVKPWALRLTCEKCPKHLLSPTTISDFWLQQLKESCYIRNGNASAVMNLSKEDSHTLWEAVVEHDLEQFRRIKKPLYNSKPQNIPIRLYTDRVVQKLVPASRTLGFALHHMLPEEFPTTRVAMDVVPIIHGVLMPMQVPLTELYEVACIDGFIHVSVQGTSSRAALDLDLQ